LTTRHPGLTGGLQLLLFANQQDYLHAFSPTAGYRVSIRYIVYNFRLGEK